MTLQVVRLGPSNPATMEPREPNLESKIRGSYPQYLYVHKTRSEVFWCRGDVIRVSNMPNSADDGIYIIRSTPANSGSQPGWMYFRFSKTDANGTWDYTDSTDTMSTSIDSAITIERVMPASVPLADGPIWYFVTPSRMVITKNVLGEHLWLYQPSSDLVPAGQDTDGRDYYTFPSGTSPGDGTGAYYDWYYKVWVNHDGDAYYSSHEPIPDAGLTDASEPADLVRLFGDVVNWGLIAYSGACDNPAILVQANPVDSDQLANINSIEGYLDITGNGGLSPGGSTPTRGALSTARQALITGWGSNSSVWDLDSRRSCERTYGVILMTDGQSNQCNPSNRSWSSSNCDDSDTPPTTNSWDSYPPGISEQLWNGLDDSSSFVTNIRTWVIGVSRFVGKCELNYTAYRGRTDASSPNDDAGFETADDPRLIGGSPGTYDPSDPYAFFANSAEELYSALVSIVTSMGAGGYATGAPSIAGHSSAGSIGFIGSTYYPTWEGHLVAYNLALDITDPNYRRWDAAEVLTDPVTPNNGVTRRLFTWDPSSSNDVVEITAGNHTSIDTICGSCGFDAQVADFALGNDGAGNPRDMLLGPIFNSTPTVIGKSLAWDQGSVENHSGFRGTYAGRRTLVWVGTSDGTVRAFDIEDGAEIFSIIPPDLLDKQVELYNVFVDAAGDAPLGQPQLPSLHIWGASNSLRYADVYFPSSSTYKTVMFITEGPGGSGVHAIDVTHPFMGRTIDSLTIAADPNYGYGNGSSGYPFEVIWSKTADGEAGTAILPGMGNSWSIPALGAVDFDEWRMQMGQGFKDNPSNANQPHVYYMNPVDGTPSPGNFSRSTPSVSNAASYFVSNQTFSDAVYWQPDADRFKQDNIITEGVQVDLNGHLWRILKSGNSMTASALLTTSDPEPMYYSPAVAAYPTNLHTHALYAFSSGSYYEKSPEINGANVGTSGNFIPKIYILERNQASGAVTHAALPIQNFPDPEGGTLGPRSQATAPPMLFIPAQGSTAPPFALYLIYDPDAHTCVGVSYIVKVDIDPTDLASLDPSAMDVYTAGEGTSGGFALAGDRVYVTQSRIGRDQEAVLIEVPDLAIPVGGGDENVNWWVELQ